MSNKKSTTSLAWLIYRAAEVKAGRKFSAADRKGKDSEWSKAMKKAFASVMTEKKKFGMTSEEAIRRANWLGRIELNKAKEKKAQEPEIAEMSRRIDAVRDQLVTVPEYDPYSLDYEERSESRRLEHKRAVEHNQVVMLRAVEDKLTPEQEQEASELGMRYEDYRNTARIAKEHDMSVKGWIQLLKAEDEAAKQRERKEDEAWSAAYWQNRNKKNVERLRRRGYAARRY